MTRRCTHVQTEVQRVAGVEMRLSRCSDCGQSFVIEVAPSRRPFCTPASSQNAPGIFARRIAQLQGAA